MTPICHLKEEWLHYEQAAEGEPGAFPVFAAPVWQPLGVLKSRCWRYGEDWRNE
jgi:hypothetical protein